jgi:hypothetical protein
MIRIISLFLGFFGPEITINFFKKQHISYQLDKGFRLVYEL